MWLQLLKLHVISALIHRTVKVAYRAPPGKVGRISHCSGYCVSQCTLHLMSSVSLPHFLFPFCHYVFLSMARMPLVDQDLLVIEASRALSDIPHSEGLLCVSDRTFAETSTWQHTTLTKERERERHPCPQRDLNLQFQQATGHRPTP